ncbi:DUF6538 domain-containing protein [Bradyrhizobium genosp. P]|uniref:DUF6538 domain-containing protein n=1 Tax=Bradyrhizobium genosp. P TaxID=83641 RepID=UPI003CF6A361
MSSFLVIMRYATVAPTGLSGARDLKPSVGKSEIKFSLRTRDPVIARIRNLEEAARLERAWSGIDAATADARGQVRARFECEAAVGPACAAAAEPACAAAGSSPVGPPPVGPNAAGGPPRIPAQAPTPLRPIFESYAKEAQLAPSTVKRWSPVVDRLIAHLGHDDAAAIARTDIVA